MTKLSKKTNLLLAHTLLLLLPDIALLAGEGHDVHVAGLAGTDGQLHTLPGLELHLREVVHQVGVTIGVVEGDQDRVGGGVIRTGNI